MESLSRSPFALPPNALRRAAAPPARPTSAPPPPGAREARPPGAPDAAAAPAPDLADPFPASGAGDRAVLAGTGLEDLLDMQPGGCQRAG